MGLLTEEECLATVGLRFNQMNTLYDIMGSDIADLLKAQRDLTHKETLKAVGEKLEDLLTHINSPKTNKRFVEALLRGEMPEEVK